MIQLRDVEFSYSGGTFSLRLDRFDVADGERLALIGPSGCGKTTLVNLIAGILTPRRGTIQVADHELTRLSDRARRDFRITQIGFVFQEFELLEYLPVLENILLPFYLNRTLPFSVEVRQRARQLAESMHLADKLRRRPRTLSHGERQRVAICRALVTTPRLLVADEPTGNLDPDNARSIRQLLIDQAVTRHTTLLFVTHNHDLLDTFDRVVDIGQFVDGGVA